MGGKDDILYVRVANTSQLYMDICELCVGILQNDMDFYDIGFIV